MKAIGTMINDKERDTSSSRMETSIREISKMGNLMERASLLGKTENLMKENGLMGLSKAMEYGKVLRVILILESGRDQRQMGMEFIFGRMEISMKESGNSV